MKCIWKPAMGALAVLLAVSPVVLESSRAQGAFDQTGDSRVRQGFAIAPVPLNLTGRNYAKVGIGSYIVNSMGVCNDCHTEPNYKNGGDPFAGEPEAINAERYLGGGRNFGPFFSRNITPDKTGRPAGMTIVEFKDTLRHGTDHDQAHPQISLLLQVMPWPVYSKMTDSDLEAIYEYLSAIPCLEGDPGVPEPEANRCQ